VSVQRVLASAIRLTRDEIDGQARLETSLEPGIEIAGTEAGLAQAFVNLLSNAALAIDGRPEDGNVISVTARSAGPDRVAIEIRDTGHGIPPDLIDHIFEPFVTTRPVGEGAGLGLSIAHNIVRELDGGITVSSEVGPGTTFRVELPGGAAPKGAIDRSTPPPGPARAGVECSSWTTSPRSATSCTACSPANTRSSR